MTRPPEDEGFATVITPNHTTTAPVALHTTSIGKAPAALVPPQTVVRPVTTTHGFLDRSSPPRGRRRGRGGDEFTPSQQEQTMLLGPLEAFPPLALSDDECKVEQSAIGTHPSHRRRVEEVGEESRV